MKNKILNTIVLLLGIAYFWVFYFYILDTNFYKDLISSYNYISIVISIINFLLSIVLLFSILNVVEYYIDKSLEKITAKTKNKYDDFVYNFLVKFIKISKYIISLYVWLQLIEIPIYIEWIISHIFSISFIFIGLFLFTWLTNNIFKVLTKRETENKALVNHLLPIINKIIVVFIWVVGMITVMSNLGYNVSALVTGAGIWGLAIALASQKSLANIFWAITVIINKPFKVGDAININNTIWTVKDIWLTYLTLIDKSGHQVMIPNETIISSSIENYSVRENRRTDFTIWVVYDTTLDQMRQWVKIIETILEKYVEDSSVSSYRVNFDTFGNFSLNIMVTYYSMVNDNYTAYLKQKEEINIEIKDRFAKAWLDMAFPTQELIIKK